MEPRNNPTLSADYRIVLPEAIRSAYGWQPGQNFAFIPKGAGLVPVPVPTQEELVGIARGANPNGFRDRL